MMPESPEPLFELPDADVVPNRARALDLMAGADRIVIAHSGGKDSGALTAVIATMAAQAGILDRLIVLHNPLGMYEWPGAADIAAAHAAHWRLRFEERAADGDLLDQVRKRRMWMDNFARFCTAWAKRDPGSRFVTEVVTELGLNRTAVVVYTLGMRGQESTARAGLDPIVVDHKRSSGVRTLIRWHPLLYMDQARVWELHREHGLPHHPAYDAGMSRVSCSLCVLASHADLKRACQLRPDLAARYADVEWEIGDSFRPRISMLELIAQAAGQPVDNARLTLLRMRTDHNRTARNLTRPPRANTTVLEHEQRTAALRARCRTLQQQMTARGYDGHLDTTWELTA
ncbi:phosphoadenosine phosphosulfate reductase family protein [Nocardiopsis flavescens]|uniref:phosphoadenosine phosphosulfate reductase domain-containing protein n=1 Tax=Nocardiopsis flavescens TaxID=758803 RepID=UPI003661A8D8